MDEPEIILDLTRLLSRVLHATPTGVDRCEMAYARGLMKAVAPERLKFAAVHPGGLYGRLPRRDVERFLDVTEERWLHRGFQSVWERRRGAMATLGALRPRLAGPRPARSIYVQASPSNLTKPQLIHTILTRERARFVCLVHDLIPVEFPEYARPDGAAQHLDRIRTIAAHADGIVANSAATLRALAPFLVASGRTPECAVAHLGTDLSDPADDHGPVTMPPEQPYFVCLGTIEPRKNHLLLLNLWRRMHGLRGSDLIPRLVLIGRRGWENEQVVDMLERCPALRDTVVECNGLPDREARALIRGACALLMPSFAEGYGMPVAEALAAGVPVICSDLPALREAGGAVPDYLDPLDGPAWLDAIDDFCQAGSPRRHAQIERMAGWRPSSWDEHMDTVLALTRTLAA